MLPIRIHGDTVHVMEATLNAGISVNWNIFGQVGASSPITLAGSVAQNLTEILSGMAFIHALASDAPRIPEPRPMIIDLRTGSMAGEAGEQAMAASMAIQVLRHWQLPCSVIAGATVSKLVDFQSGYEKAPYNSVLFSGRRQSDYTGSRNSGKPYGCLLCCYGRG